MTRVRSIDNARCPGFGDGPEDWLNECHDCLRRKASGGEPWAPPQVVALWCEDYIPPDHPEDQRLRELARRQGVGAETRGDQ